ncbi:MAG TPA: sensor histidine kinase [Jatrophihabitans sp.]|nr:sensor histidine kinase [Jatrophihabitans sp.]
MARSRALASQILLAVLAILLATVVIGGVLDVQLTRQSLDKQYEQRARVTAVVVADMPQLPQALASNDPAHIIQPLATRIARSTGAAYVVVTDRSGIRYSHPNPALIGQRLEEPVAVLDGHDHVGIDPGSLGRSANGKAPIFDSSGRVIGQVSVGILETEVAAQVAKDVLAIVTYSALALAVGAAVALLLARRIKRVTFGLELNEIAALVQEREAMLHGIREGVIGFDSRGRVSLINGEARRLLGIAGTATGQRLDELIPSGRLQDVLAGRVPGADQSVLTSEALLVVNRRPVIVAGRDVGSIVTLRDRTELEAMIRRMHAVTGLANALRAQEHEFTNRLHVIAGLLDLDETEEARRYLDTITGQQFTSAEDLRARIRPPVLAALLLAKLAVAGERGVSLTITEDSHLEAGDSDAQMLMTIIGNLVDNAIDATAGQPEPRTVQVRLTDEDGLRIVVTDNGPGVAPEHLTDIFTDGFSTKPDRGELRRGIGLALVHRLVHRAGGRIEAMPGPGGQFVVQLPRRAPGQLASTGGRDDRTAR